MPLNVQQLTPNVVNFGANDLETLLDTYGFCNLELLDPNASTTLAIIPDRSDIILRRTELVKPDDPLYIADPDVRRCAAAEAPEFIADYERELQRLKELGADNPSHTTFLVASDPDYNGDPQFYTATQRLPNGERLNGPVRRNPDYHVIWRIGSLVRQYYTTSATKGEWYADELGLEQFNRYGILMDIGPSMTNNPVAVLGILEAQISTKYEQSSNNGRF